jgi:hypothetical protein
MPAIAHHNVLALPEDFEAGSFESGFYITGFEKTQRIFPPMARRDYSRFAINSENRYGVSSMNTMGMKRHAGFAIRAFSAVFLIAIVEGLAATPASSTNADPCEHAIAQGAVCEAANARATDLMNARKLEAATAVFDVRTGALIAFAATPGPDAARKESEPLTVSPSAASIASGPPRPARPSR